ncbi:hypothetical protein [Methanobacterium petrolearium]|nr:hypothetical protein [Methanobacterium petrolearium]MBP1945896.1 hypothetical protein [Methanobacterium petrolearium]BDZ69549.1 hypothetical protein GCM10025861_00660 [Methanobacterium petrolearium]
MAKFYKIRDFLDDESVEKFINELIEENMEYIRAKYRQLLKAANNAKTNF